MNQPTSHCHCWVDDLVCLSEINEIEAVHSPQEDWNPPNPPSLGRFDGEEAAMDVTIDSGPSKGFMEEFPGAAKIFQGGEQNTFLCKFDQDPLFKRMTSEPILFIRFSSGLGIWTLVNPFWFELSCHRQPTFHRTGKSF